MTFMCHLRRVRTFRTILAFSGPQREFRVALAGPLMAVAGFAGAPAPGGENWGGFRGPAGGVAETHGLPDHWSKTENVQWVVEIPGRGWSCPVVWGDRVFVTSAISDGKFKEPSKGIFGDAEVAELVKGGMSEEEAGKKILDRDIENTTDPAQAVTVHRMVYCLDAKSGKIVWEREAQRGVPPFGRHRKNTYASGSPVTDGKAIFAYFGNIGVYAYTMAGEPLWSHTVAPTHTRLDFGDGASLAEYGDWVYLLNDNEESCYLRALEKKTGSVAWEKKRDQASSWATPLVWKNKLRTEIVAAGPKTIVSYDPKTGDELWTMRVGALQVASTPVATADYLYFSAAQAEGNIRPLMAIRPGGKGDITVPPEQENGQFVAWRNPKAGASIPSPVVYDGRAYVLYDRGFLGAYDLTDGKQLYRERIGENSSPPFTASPWACDGKVYCLSEDGDTFVFKAGEKFELLGKNSLDEMCMASPAVVDGSVFIRTMTRLYRIGKS